jgi:hypothetical protein
MTLSTDRHTPTHPQRSSGAQGRPPQRARAPRNQHTPRTLATHPPHHDSSPNPPATRGKHAPAQCPPHHKRSHRQPAQPRPTPRPARRILPQLSGDSTNLSTVTRTPQLGGHINKTNKGERADGRRTHEPSCGSTLWRTPHQPKPEPPIAPDQCGRVSWWVRMIHTSSRGRKRG